MIQAWFDPCVIVEDFLNLPYYPTSTPVMYYITYERSLTLTWIVESEECDSAVVAYFKVCNIRSALWVWVWQDKWSCTVNVIHIFRVLISFYASLLHEEKWPHEKRPHNENVRPFFENPMTPPPRSDIKFALARAMPAHSNVSHVGNTCRSCIDASF